MASLLLPSLCRRRLSWNEHWGQYLPQRQWQSRRAHRCRLPPLFPSRPLYYGCSCCGCCCRREWRPQQLQPQPHLGGNPCCSSSARGPNRFCSFVSEPCRDWQWDFQEWLPEGRLPPYCGCCRCGCPSCACDSSSCSSSSSSSSFPREDPADGARRRKWCRFVPCNYSDCDCDSDCRRENREKRPCRRPWRLRSENALPCGATSESLFAACNV
mmetsp:Transcript_5777/g.11841  ORF Transcript_5777/g.11841 Transcript_5777/m.11841 type:complete len:213 (+) Transcript_5777:4481-5119(+)